jgi:hypothetical protein
LLTCRESGSCDTHAFSSSGFTGPSNERGDIPIAVRFEVFTVLGSEFEPPQIFVRDGVVADESIEIMPFRQQFSVLAHLFV